MAGRDRIGNARHAASSTSNRGSARRSPRSWRRSSSWSRSRPTTALRRPVPAPSLSATCAPSVASPATTPVYSAARASAAPAVCTRTRKRAVSSGPPEQMAGDKVWRCVMALDREDAVSGGAPSKSAVLELMDKRCGMRASMLGCVVAEGEGMAQRR